MKRHDGRSVQDLRETKITKDYLKFADGSVLIEVGDTHVICTATIEERVPSFLAGKGLGWVTAEYSMLPGSSNRRITRESKLGRVGGRTHEIQRLIGRSLRSVTDMAKLGERTILIDCDVIQADGGTRCASITGAFVAYSMVVNKLIESGAIKNNPIGDTVAAVSVGIIGGGKVVLDLNYEEDSTADVDMNIVMTGTGGIIEVQGTAEGAPFTREELDKLYETAAKGIDELTAIQKSVLG